MSKRYLLASIFITGENMVMYNHLLSEHMSAANVRVIDNWEDEDGDMFVTFNLINEVGAMDFVHWLYEREQTDIPWLEFQGVWYLSEGQIFHSNRP